MSRADTSTDTLPTMGPGTSPDGRHRPLAPAESRGELTIDPQVVEKIAAAAVIEVDQVGGAARRVLGVSLGSDSADQRPRVQAKVDGAGVTVEVRCSVAYPAPVALVTERVRAHLIARIEALTGLSTREVDITVTALTSTSASTRRELR
jgi:uncharacterized alkaline shock family protein YloU